MEIIRGFTLYQNRDRVAGDDGSLKPCVEKVFRAICSMGEEKEVSGEVGTKNLRVKQQKLKRYLSKRYNTRLALKLCALFDWSKRELDFKEFYSQYDQIF